MFFGFKTGLGSWSNLLWYKGSPTNNFIKGTMVMNGDIMVYFLLMKCIRRDHDNQDVWESALTTRSKFRKYTSFFSTLIILALYIQTFSWRYKNDIMAPSAMHNSIVLQHAPSDMHTTSVEQPTTIYVLLSDLFSN